MRSGSCPSRYGATDSCRYASTACAPKNVSPSPTRPWSVCTWTQTRFGYSRSRIVSTAVTFIAHPFWTGSLLEKDLRQHQREPRDERHDEQANDEDAEIGNHVAGSVDHVHPADRTRDEETHADRRQEDADADRGDHQDPIVQRIDAELRGDRIHHRNEHDQRGQRLENGAEEN